jgi:hypothetical protein
MPLPAPLHSISRGTITSEPLSYKLHLLDDCTHGHNGRTIISTTIDEHALNSMCKIYGKGEELDVIMAGGGLLNRHSEVHLKSTWPGVSIRFRACTMPFAAL